MKVSTLYWSGIITKLYLWLVTLNNCSVQRFYKTILLMTMSETLMMLLGQKQLVIVELAVAASPEGNCSLAQAGVCFFVNPCGSSQLRIYRPSRDATKLMRSAHPHGAWASCPFLFGSFEMGEPFRQHLSHGQNKKPLSSWYFQRIKCFV